MKPISNAESFTKVVEPGWCGVEEAIEFQRKHLNPCEARKFAHIPKVTAKPILSKRSSDYLDHVLRNPFKIPFNG